MTFTAYLQNMDLAKRSIQHYTARVERFSAWLGQEQVSAEAFSYNDLMAFMQGLQQEGASTLQVSGHLTAIRHYCSYLIHERQRTDNPAAGVFVRGIIRSVPVNLLTTEEMDLLYQQYQIQLSVHVSNKIMLGLLVYQGLSVGELMRLKAHHFLMKDGKILIRGTHHTGERILPLQAHQVPVLQQYLRQHKDGEGYLFTEPRKQQVSEKNISNRLQYMFYQLRQLNPKVISAKQIRMSVITNWLKKHSLRETQYLAGHKYVSSTARYQTTNLDDLQQALKDHHPLK